MARPSSTRRTVLLVFLAAGAVLFGHRFRLLTPVEQAVATAVRPLAAGLATTGRWLASKTSVGGGASLRAENEALRQEIQQLLVAQETLRGTLQDAADLERAERALGSRQLTGVSARLIGRSPDPTFQVYLVNRGARQGIQPGAVALAGEGVVVGTVLEVEPELARVLALTDPRTRVSSRVEDGRASTGLLRGTYGLTLTLEFLDKDAPVAAGHIVVTSGADAAIPAGLVIGRIQSVDNPLGSLFQTATVAPAAWLRAASIVTIVNHA